MRGQYCYCGNKKEIKDDSCEECKEIEAGNKAHSLRRMYPNKPDKQLRVMNLCFRGKLIANYNWKTDFKI